MKKIRNILAIFMMALCMVFASCNSCTKTTPEPEFAGYNFDEVTVSDYDYIASQYPDFKFYEVDVVFDTAVANPDAYIKALQTVFQVNDTCIIIRHNEDMTADTIMVQDYWMECMPMNARNAVNFDSCMSIIEPYRDRLNNCRMTFRRVLAPPFPENGQYIFGPGLFVVDAATGEIVDWDITNDTVATTMDNMLGGKRIGCPLGEWP